MIRSDTPMIACMICSIMRIVMPLPFIFLINSTANVTSVGFSPAITSSSNKSSGFVANALAISRRFCSAMVRSLARRTSFSGSPTNSNSSIASRLASELPRVAPNKDPISTFSRTVIWRNSCTD